MERCRLFLAEKNPQASRRAAEAIKSHLLGLSDFPEIGRPHDDEPTMRELLIPFGDSGYVALYRFEAITNMVVVLAFRHQREAGY
ncbi:type II toxin-antitoxin system RelE/ParE family toxin [Ferrovibrio sp.]